MRILDELALTTGERRALIDRAAGFDRATAEAAAAVCEDVRARGDAAVRDATLRFDRVEIESFRVPASEMHEAFENADPKLKDAILTAASNIRAFHGAQARPEPEVETMPGVRCWRERRPIDTVGLYVPAGSAPLPSTVLMLGIPALLAGCRRIIICSPPQRDGSVDQAVVTAAEMIGIREIYRCGGVQAVAAMAFGTASIPKVEKVFGPGNKYVTAAKNYVAAMPEGCAIDLPAGPSELLILADESANPRSVAIDLLSQAEHDPESQVILATDNRSLAEAVAAALPELLKRLPRKAIAAAALELGAIVVCPSIENAVAFSNEYAPEHLSIQTRDPRKLTASIRHAGSVFLGPYAPVTAGDYASGTNHTLPTAGMARRYSGVSVESYQTVVSFQELTREGLASLAPALTTLAAAEGLDAHKRAVEMRLEKK